MSTNITRTNGTILGTIIDGTQDTTHTSLALVGKNFSGYGQVITDDLVKLLENFSNTIAPSNPLSGQIWWDTTSNILKVYTGAAFKIVGSATAQADAPTSPIVGDIWWKSTTNQLHIYNGTVPYNEAGWVLVGPTWPSTAGKSGALWEQILDNSSTLHDVITLYLNDVKTGIISSATFTPNVAIPGFTTIVPGYNIVNTGIYSGTANNAFYLGSVISTNYLRTDINNVATGNLHIVNNTGITIGANLDASFNISNNELRITNTNNNANIGLYANVGGTSTLALTVDGSTGLLSVIADPTAALGVPTKQYIDNKFTNGEFFGNTIAPTASFGTNTPQIATTAFVQAAFDQTRIFKNDTQFALTDTGVGSAQLLIDGIGVLSATSSGVILNDGASATTQTQTSTGTGDGLIATTNYVKTATQWWGGSAKFVSNAAPTSGDGALGDFWFQTEL